MKVAFGIAEGAAKEHGGAVADIGADEGRGEGWTVKVGEGGVDGVGEILFGVDESAIEIEDDESGRHEGDCSGELDASPLIG